MAGLWTRYMESTSATRSTIVSQIIQASPTSVSASDRKGLVQNILDDIESGSFSKQDIPNALLAIKTLARLPEGSTVLVKQSNLRVLYKLASPSNPAAVSSETLRCIANALLLVESGRDAWIAIDGGQLCLQYLRDPKTSEEFCFLTARILFLSTLKQCSFLQKTAEDKKVLESIAERCEALLEGINAGKPMARDALTDLLKLIFNLFLQYPRMIDAESDAAGKEKKVMGEQWSPGFDPLIAPLTHIFVGLPVAKPPLVAPLTHVIHALLNIPVIPYANIWFPSSSPPASLRDAPTKGKLKKRQETPSEKDKDKELKPSTSSFTDPFQRAMSLLSSPRRSFSSSGSARPDPPRRSMGSNTVSPSRSKSGSQAPSPTRARSSSPVPNQPAESGKGTATPNAVASSSSSTTTAMKYQLVHHACALLDSTLETYWPGTTEADSAEVRSSAKRDGLVLDEVLTPLVVLLARLGADLGARTEMRKWLLPDDLDRKDPLESRGDVLGRCMRLLASVYFPRLKDAIGEWIYVLAGEDGSTLSSLIGYGNAAGFLFNKGILSAPPPPPSSSSASTSANGSISIPENVNPITGRLNRDDEEDDGPEMTEEEKEREAERLFVLFDRLEKSGMVQNPVRKAIQEGKFSLGPFGP